MSLLFEIDDDFSIVKVRMTTNDARCSVVVEHLAPGQTSTTGEEVGVPLSLGYDERGRVVLKLHHASGAAFESLSLGFQQEWVGRLYASFRNGWHSRHSNTPIWFW